MKKEEPLDNILEIPYPRLLRDSIDLLLTNNVFSKRELLMEFSNAGFPMESSELEKLFVLEKGYLSIDTDDTDFSPIVLKMEKKE